MFLDSWSKELKYRKKTTMEYIVEIGIWLF